MLTRATPPRTMSRVKLLLVCCAGAGVRELKVAEIRRPLARTRSNNAAKVEALMKSIQEHGLKEPIDVLEVSGPSIFFVDSRR